MIFPFEMSQNLKILNYFNKAFLFLTQYNLRPKNNKFIYFIGRYFRLYYIILINIRMNVLFV